MKNKFEEWWDSVPILKYASRDAAMELLVALIGTIITAYILSFNGCGFKVRTGVPCPGCGMTHALIYFCQLKFKEAWLSNPCIFVYAPGAVFYLFFVDRIKYGRIWAFLSAGAILLGVWVYRYHSYLTLSMIPQLLF